MSMKKKYLVALLAFVLVVLGVVLFVFFSNQSKIEESPTDKDGHITTYTTESAVIKENDAIVLIKSYSAEELSLSEEDYSGCQFMVRKSGNKINGDYYIQVIATYPTETTENGETYYKFDTKGEYYIRYDGKEILKKNLEDDTYDKLEVKELPETTTKGADAHS